MKNLIPLLFLLFTACNPLVPIEGNVLYSHDQGVKLPDKFAEVWIISKPVLDTIGKTSFFTQMNAFSMRWADYKLERTKESINAEIMKGEMDAYSQKLFFKFDTIQENPATVKLLCDNNGKFSTTIKRGEYFIIVRSANVKDLNMFEILGKMEIDPVTIKKNMDPIFIEIGW